MMDGTAGGRSPKRRAARQLTVGFVEGVHGVPMGAGWRQLWSDVRCREAQDFNGHTPRRISIWSVDITVEWWRRQSRRTVNSLTDGTLSRASDARCLAEAVAIFRATRIQRPCARVSLGVFSLFDACTA